jgi:hypothetical protein
MSPALRHYLLGLMIAIDCWRRWFAGCPSSIAAASPLWMMMVVAVVAAAAACSSLADSQ